MTKEEQLKEMLKELNYKYQSLLVKESDTRADRNHYRGLVTANNNENIETLLTNYINSQSRDDLIQLYLEDILELIEANSVNKTLLQKNTNYLKNMLQNIKKAIETKNFDVEYITDYDYLDEKSEKFINKLIKEKESKNE